MRSYPDRALVAFGLAVVAGLISLACTGPPAAEKAADKSALTAEQCIDDNSTDGPVEPLEDALLTAGVVEKDLEEITLTQDMCKEVVERTPGGSPVERAAAVGNLTQELGIIENTMENASEGDVDGDGGVDAKDGEIATSASFAASRAARRSITQASEEGLSDGDASTEIDAHPVAYLAQQQTTSVPAQTSSSPSTTGPTAESTYESTTAAAAAASATASAAADGAQQVGGSVRDEARGNASRAARRAGAGQKAAAGGSQCAATVKLTDTTLRVTRGYVAFKGPARELRWNDSDEARLVVAPKALSSIEELRREVGRAEGAGKAEADCMHLGTQIEPIMLSNDDGLSIEWHDPREKDIRRDTSVSWTWGIRASQSGPHYLILHLEQHVNTEAAGEARRSFEESPFDDYIVRVHATRWQFFASFLGSNWQVFVPVFLTLLTAIVILLVVFFWKRRTSRADPEAYRTGLLPTTGGCDLPTEFPRGRESRLIPSRQLVPRPLPCPAESARASGAAVLVVGKQSFVGGPTNVVKDHSLLRGSLYRCHLLPFSALAPRFHRVPEQRKRAGALRPSKILFLACAATR